MCFRELMRLARVCITLILLVGVGGFKRGLMTHRLHHPRAGSERGEGNKKAHASKNHTMIVVRSDVYPLPLREAEPRQLSETRCIGLSLCSGIESNTQPSSYRTRHLWARDKPSEDRPGAEGTNTTGKLSQQHQKSWESTTTTCHSSARDG